MNQPINQLNQLNQLNQQFSLQNEDNHLQIVQGEGDIPVVEIRNVQASARISLQGAQLLSWIPQGEEEVIWLSKDASFKPGKSVRGGIPICWPPPVHLFFRRGQRRT